MKSEPDYVQEEASVHGRSESPPSSLQSNKLALEKDFILTFQTLTALWDKSNPQYTNKYKRNDSLQKLLPILKKLQTNATVDDVKRKINTLRSNYRRELNKIALSKKSDAGTEEIYVPKIWYFPYLRFLGTLQQQEPEPRPESESASEAEQTNHQSNQQSRKITQKRLFSSISPSSISSTKKRKQINEEELLDYAGRCLSEPCTQNIQKINLSNPIALEWSNTLDRLDPLQLLYAKKAINDILFEAELGNLHRNSVRINDDSSPPPHQTAHVTYASTEAYSPYSHYSSPKDSIIPLTLLSQPNQPSPHHNQHQ